MIFCNSRARGARCRSPRRLRRLCQWRVLLNREVASSMNCSPTTDAERGVAVLAAPFDEGSRSQKDTMSPGASSSVSPRLWTVTSLTKITPSPDGVVAEEVRCAAAASNSLSAHPVQLRNNSRANAARSASWIDATTSRPRAHPAELFDGLELDGSFTSHRVPGSRRYAPSPRRWCRVRQSLR